MSSSDMKGTSGRAAARIADAVATPMPFSSHSFFKPSSTDPASAHAVRELGMGDQAAAHPDVWFVTRMPCSDMLPAGSAGFTGTQSTGQLVRQNDLKLLLSTNMQ